MIKVTKPKH